MTLPGDAALPSPTDLQPESVEKTAMYRSPWELAALVRHRTAYLTDERRICSQIDQHDDGPASLVTQLRHRLAIGLIRVGHALAGHATVRGLPRPSARPATWGPGS
jgi:hypothetical protein